MSLEIDSTDRQLFVTALINTADMASNAPGYASSLQPRTIGLRLMRGF